MTKPLPPATAENLLPPIVDPGVHTYFADHAAHPFEPLHLSLRNAWWLMECSLLAYASPPPALWRFHEAGLAAESIAGESTQAYVVSGERFAIVAFRGTEVPRPPTGEEDRPWPERLAHVVADITTDTRICLDSWRHGGRVHHGFREALDQVWSHVLDSLDRLTKDCEPGGERAVFFTGHSLGGALATLAADAYLHERGPCRLCTFGCPRVGDAAFARRFEIPAWRFVNNNDIATRVPRAGWPGPSEAATGLLSRLLEILRGRRAYRHVGTLHYLDADGDLSTDTDAIERIFESLHGQVRRLVGSAADLVRTGTLVDFEDFLADHAPLYYAIHVWNAYEATQPQAKSAASVSHETGRPEEHSLA
jgi:hypothetical protein